MEIEFDNKLCRLCLKNVGIIPLFKQHEGDNVAEMISAIYNINVIFDIVLPDCACSKCFENIKIAINTKESIVNSEIMLNTYLETKKTIAESVEEHKNETTSTSKLIDRGVEEPEDSSQASEENLKTLIKTDLKNSQTSFYSNPSKLYVCEKCEFKTDTYKRLVFHMRCHADAKMYECEQCGKEYKARSRYLEHATIHCLDNQYKCKICSKSFKGKQNLDQHLLIHKTERNIPCPNCDKTFCHKKGLRSHLLIHNEKNIACETCGKTFKHNTFLKIHVATRHGKPVAHNRKTRLTSSQELPQKVPCEICGMLLSAHAVRNHINSKHSNKGRFKCSYCEKDFSKSVSLQQHMQFHINSKTTPLDPDVIESYLKYKCDECKKAFTSSIALKNHKVMHSGLKEFGCFHCGKEFAFKVYLERHIRLNHDKTNPRNFVCNICGKVSTDSSGSKLHMLAHTGETPFHCKFCDSKYRYAKSLRIHISKKHKTKDNKDSKKSSR